MALVTLNSIPQSLGPGPFLVQVVGGSAKFSWGAPLPTSGSDPGLQLWAPQREKLETPLDIWAWSAEGAGCSVVVLPVSTTTSGGGSSAGSINLNDPQGLTNALGAGMV